MTGKLIGREINRGAKYIRYPLRKIHSYQKKPLRKQLVIPLFETVLNNVYMTVSYRPRATSDRPFDRGTHVAPFSAGRAGVSRHHQGALGNDAGEYRRIPENTGEYRGVSVKPGRAGNHALRGWLFYLFVGPLSMFHLAEPKTPSLPTVLCARQTLPYRHTHTHPLTHPLQGLVLKASRLKTSWEAHAGFPLSSLNSPTRCCGVAHEKRRSEMKGAGMLCRKRHAYSMTATYVLAPVQDQCILAAISTRLP